MNCKRKKRITIMGSSQNSEIMGVAIVDKEVGWTSHDVVARARKIIGVRKIGHSGTLDPDATGVLVLGVGRATRILRFLNALSKSYTAQIVFGVETSTLDASGEVTARHDMSYMEFDDVKNAASELVGEIEQVPPMVSAVRVGGRRLYEIAREGGVVERQSRPVTVHRLEVRPTEDSVVYEIVVECSSGTYIRTLASDLGHKLGGGAHLRHLRRTAIGSFTVRESKSVENLTLLPASLALRDFSAITVDERTASEVSHGVVFDYERLEVSGNGPWPVHGPDGSLLAVYEEHNGRVKPVVVLAG